MKAKATLVMHTVYAMILLAMTNRKRNTSKSFAKRLRPWLNMKGFLTGVAIVPMMWIAYHIANWYLMTAKYLGANTFRPKDVMGPYVTCFGVALFLWGMLILAVIEIEKVNKESKKDGE